LITFSLLNTQSEYWDAFVTLYLESFPPDERREVDELINIQGVKNYSLNQITFNGQFIGFIEVWLFNEFAFLEHIAIITKEQQKGYGSEALILLLKKLKIPVILEAEPPVNVISSKRIMFYQKSGFVLLDVDYSQPPYYPGKQSVPMLLLSNTRIHQNRILEYVNEIKDCVYKLY
jgi:hypothetical protein